MSAENKQIRNLAPAPTPNAALMLGAPVHSCTIPCRWACETHTIHWGYVYRRQSFIKCSRCGRIEAV